MADDYTWIKLHRKLLDNGLMKNPNLLQLFIYCLLRANHKPNEIIFNNELVRIERGSFITGRFEIAKDLKMNPASVYKNLKKLEKLSYISLNSNNKFTMLTVIKYNSYQDRVTTTEQQSNNKVTTKEQQSNTNNNDNKENKEKKTKYFSLPVELDKKITPEQWNEWQDYRKEIKKPLTPTAISKQVKFLTEQPNPAECINTAIMNSWQGLFEVRGNGQTPQPEKKYTTEEYRNVFGELAE